MTLRLRLGRLFLIYIIFQNKNIDNQHSLKYNINQKQCNEKRRLDMDKINVQIFIYKKPSLNSYKRRLTSWD